MKRMTVKEFQAYSEAFARGEIPKKKPATTPKPKPKAQPTPKPKPAPKARAKRVTVAALNDLERRLDRLERSTITTWGEALAHIAKRDGIGMAAAGLKAAKEFPELHPARRAK